jgi:hypothetical protein
LANIDRALAVLNMEPDADFLAREAAARLFDAID